MVKVRIKETGIIKEVTRNEAHDLIDRGIAELATTSIAKPQTYSTRHLRSRHNK